MCGIFGVLNTKNNSGLEQCAKRLEHRGPDDFGSYYKPDQGIYLAHCRLSIIDVSTAGRQPMSNEDDSIWLTFNGEIYNYKALRNELLQEGHIFKSQADSEVIIHAYEQWGIACVERFEGMFAFGLWDSNIKRFFLVRDRVGIKPLYFFSAGDQFAFASEPKALIGLPGYVHGIDASALQSFLIYSYIEGKNSIWKGIQRLGAGQILTFSPGNGHLDISSYWKLEVRQSNLTAEESQEEFGELLEQSLRSHLISDVPLGVFLSGGIDSSAVADMAARLKPGIDAMSIGFAESENDEIPTARKTAEKIGAGFHPAFVSKGSQDELMQVFTFLDEPLGDSSIFPTYLVSKEARKQVKVALSGDGGDELFGGYNWYSQTEQARKLKKVLFFAGSKLGPSVTGRNTMLKRMDKFQHYLFLNSPAFTHEEIRALFPSLISGAGGLDEAYLFRKWARADLEPFKSWQYSDFHTYLVDSNLVKVDRLSMACSLEVRVPLLDHRLVEFAFSLPDSLCINGQKGKSVLREYLRLQGLLHVLSQPKKGFSFSVNQLWPLSQMLTLLSTSHMVRDGLMESRCLTRTLERSHEHNYTNKVWLLAVLEMWYQCWFDAAGI